MVQRTPPILVTGMPRSATSWAGRMLEASGRVVYINEPMNTEHPPGRSPGILRAPIKHRFQYITGDNEGGYLQAFRDTLALRYSLREEIRVNRKPGDLARMLKYWTAFSIGRVSAKRPLLDDPFAVFSTEWFARSLGCQTVVMVRHPAAIVNSRKRLGNRTDFRHLLAQPLLLRDWLGPFQREMREMMERPDDLVGQGSLLWRMIYQVVAECRERVPLAVLRHEDLSRDPIAGFSSLFALLDLPFGERARKAVVRSSTNGQSRLSHTWTLSRSGLSKSGFKRLDSRRHAASWKTTLSGEEIARIRALTDDVASLYYTAEEWAV